MSEPHPDRLRLPRMSSNYMRLSALQSPADRGMAAAHLLARILERRRTVFDKVEVNVDMLDAMEHDGINGAHVEGLLIWLTRRGWLEPLAECLYGVTEAGQAAPIAPLSAIHEPWNECSEPTYRIAFLQGFLEELREWQRHCERVRLEGSASPSVPSPQNVRFAQLRSHLNRRMDDAVRMLRDSSQPAGDLANVLRHPELIEHVTDAIERALSYYDRHPSFVPGAQLRALEPVSEGVQSVTTAPKVFISYAWEDDGHNAWVERFAAALRGRGINATIDRWELVPGSPLSAFMETQIRESSYVLMICTAPYKQKYDERRGGAGFEAHLVGGQTLVHGKHEKFIPILRRETEATAVPSAHQGKLYVDLRKDDELTGAQFEDLVGCLQGKGPARGGPPIVPHIGPLVVATTAPPMVPSSAVDHDRLVFSKLNGILDEEHYVDIVDWLGDCAFVEDDRLKAIQSFRSFLTLSQNAFLDITVEGEKSILLDKLSRLLSFISKHFFRRDGAKSPTDSVYLYPDLNLDLNPGVSTEKQLLFDKRNSELGEHCDDAIVAYRAFRLAVKHALLV